MLKWLEGNSDNKYFCPDIYGNRAVCLVRGEDVIRFYDEGELFEISPSQVTKVLVTKPGLFKKGYIGFYGADNEFLSYSYDGTKKSKAISVSRMYRFHLYLIVSILEANGFEISYL